MTFETKPPLQLTQGQWVALEGGSLITQLLLQFPSHKQIDIHFGDSEPDANAGYHTLNPATVENNFGVTLVGQKVWVRCATDDLKLIYSCAVDV